MESKQENAVFKFENGFNCAQAVLSSFAKELKEDEEKLCKIACGFGAGMGRNEEVCGAVSGGIMVLGLKYGKCKKEDTNAMDTTYQKTRELMQEFKEKHGSYICSALLNGCNLKTEEGQKQFKEKGMKKNICIPCVKTVIEILEKQ
jgi:C_GCAxxG_C_C family probable redox protein